jgi:hypothetical protein
MFFKVIDHRPGQHPASKARQRFMDAVRLANIKKAFVKSKTQRLSALGRASLATEKVIQTMIIIGDKSRN